jgi:tetratricopeptide (TPR) repeat protein
MELGSIQQVTERLRSWCVRQDRGLARVEWDSAFARQEVVDRLRRSLDSSGISLVQIGLPPGEAAEETVAGLIEKLRSVSGSVVSITDIEWAFPERGNRLDTLAGLSFQRETLASLPVRQIWWVPSSLTERFVLGVPDLDSWFQLRLHLTEVPPPPADAGREVEGTERKTVSVTEARSVARRFWERLEAARAKNIPEDRIWTELAQPALDALLSAGLRLEAGAILALTSGARGALERSLEELVAARGPEDSAVLSATTRLARLLGDQGDFAGARRLQERVLEVSRRVLGEEHRDTLASMSNLAATLLEQGDLDGARQLQERVLEVMTRVSGDEHPDTLTAMNNLAATLLAQGDYGGARRLQERVLDVRKRVLGEEHPDTPALMGNLAATLSAQGDLNGARQLEERVLEVRTRVLGGQHPDTLTAMNNLAILLFEAGDREEALRLLRECLLGRRKVLGENHPDTVATAELLTRLEAQAQASQPGG